jgi:hypothetical protein
MSENWAHAGTLNTIFYLVHLPEDKKLRRHEHFVQDPEHPPLGRISGDKMRHRSCCGADRCRHGVTR